LFNTPLLLIIPMNTVSDGTTTKSITRGNGLKTNSVSKTKCTSAQLAATESAMPVKAANAPEKNTQAQL
jgi:hypothetical protein